MDKPRVTVAIPCYNCAGTVLRAVESAVSQNFDAMEVVCVDDGSSDETPRALARLRERYPKIVVTRQRNGGAPRARNRALEASSGLYVQFLDADDELLPGKIQRQVRLIEEEGTDFVAGSFYYRGLSGVDTLRQVACEDPWVALPHVRLGITSANLFRRAALEAVNGWDEGRKSSQEYDLMFRLLQNGSAVSFDRTPGVIVHQQRGSITQIDRSGDTLRRLVNLAEIQDYLNSSKNGGEPVEATKAAIFGAVRHLANYDLAASFEAFDRYLPEGYSPQPNAGTTRIYIWVYKLFGFRRAELVRAWSRRLRGRCSR